MTGVHGEAAAREATPAGGREAKPSDMEVAVGKVAEREEERES